MKAIAMLLLALGTIASSIALAPIPRMTRLFEKDLTDISKAVTEGIEKLQDAETKRKAEALYPQNRFLGMTEVRRATLIRKDLDTLIERLGGRQSLADKVRLGIEPVEVMLAARQKIAKAVESAGTDAAARKKAREEATKAHQKDISPAKQRLAIIERQLKENLDGRFPEDYQELHFIGKTTDDRREALGSDIVQLASALGEKGAPIIDQANRSLALFDDQMTARKAADADRWANPVWWLFALGFVGMVGGILMNRKLVAESAAAEAARAQGSGGDIRGHIGDVIRSVSRLAGRPDTIGDRELHAELDRVIGGPLFDLVEGRGVLQTILGIRDYAMAMSHLASAERGLNRAWCALTDEYPDEARRSVARANGALKRFMELLDGRITLEEG